MKRCLVVRVARIQVCSEIEQSRNNIRTVVARSSVQWGVAIFILGAGIGPCLYQDRDRGWVIVVTGS